MNVSRKEAQESLDEIESVILHTRQALAHGVSSIMLILWGVIWVVGYSGTQFYPQRAGLLWPLLIVIGAVASWIVGARRRSTPRNANGGRIGAFWLVLFGYSALWLVLLHPTQLPAGAEWANYQPLNG